MEAILFYCPQMENLARRIAARDTRVTLGEISWKRFPDKFPNIFIEKQRDIRRSNVAFLASFDEPGDIFEQLAAFWTLARCGAQLMQLILPYFPTGTMERVDTEGQVATAKTLARMVSATPLCGQGPAELVSYDFHTLQMRFYFDDGIVPRLKTGIKYLKRELQKLENVCVVYPDYGSRRRYKRMLSEHPDAVCEKVRDGDKRKITIVEGNPTGMHAVLVDDLIQTGGTLIEAKNTLLAAGAKEVSFYATHGVFPKESWRKFIGAGFTHGWITDSCPRSAAAVQGIAPFEVLSLDESIARVIVDEDDRDERRFSKN